MLRTAGVLLVSVPSSNPSLIAPTVHARSEATARQAVVARVRTLGGSFERVAMSLVQRVLC